MKYFILITMLSIVSLLGQSNDITREDFKRLPFDNSITLKPAPYIVEAVHNNTLADTVKWTKLNGPYGATITALYSIGDTILAGTGIDVGIVFYSTNKGNSWNQSDIKVHETIRGFIQANDGSIIAAVTGKQTGLYKTQNLKNWIRLNVPQDQDYWSLGKGLDGAIYAGTEYKVISNYAYIYKSKDNGNSWTRIFGSDDRKVSFLT